MGQVLLQSKADIKKWDNFYYKVKQVSHSEEVFIAESGRYYKVTQLLQISAVHKTNERNGIGQ